MRSSMGTAIRRHFIAFFIQQNHSRRFSPRAHDLSAMALDQIKCVKYGFHIKGQALSPSKI